MKCGDLIIDYQCTCILTIDKQMSRVAFFPVLADIAHHHGVVVNSSFPHPLESTSLRCLSLQLKVLNIDLIEALVSSVEVVGPIVDGEVVGLTVLQSELALLDSVTKPTDGGSKITITYIQITYTTDNPLNDQGPYESLLKLNYLLDMRARYVP